MVLQNTGQRGNRDGFDGFGGYGGFGRDGHPPKIQPTFSVILSREEEEVRKWVPKPFGPEGPIVKLNSFSALFKFRDKKGTPKNFCDQDFAELSGELSGAICLKSLVLLGGALELFRKFFGAVRAICWLWGSFFGS